MLFEVRLLNETDAKPVVHIEYLPLAESVCVVFAESLVLYSLVTREADCVGMVTDRVQAASWSPDQELLIVITGASNLLCLTKDFDVLKEQPTAIAEFGAAVPINVGWGKVETQFQGKAGKLVSQPRLEPAKTPVQQDSSQRISWRGDGDFFVTSTLDPSTSHRVLRVWNRDCVLQSTSEDVPGLESALTWRPSGNLIASSQQHPHRHEIVFFESNGLRHGQFTLPFQPHHTHVRELAWSCDSTVLSVWTEILPTAGVPFESHLQLWVSSNYHWYLKQEYRFSVPLTAVAWHPEEPASLHVLVSDGLVYLYFFFQPCFLRGGGGTPHIGWRDSAVIRNRLCCQCFVCAVVG